MQCPHQLFCYRQDPKHGTPKPPYSQNSAQRQSNLFVLCSFMPWQPSSAFLQSIGHGESNPSAMTALFCPRNLHSGQLTFSLDILTWYPGMTELTLEGLRVDCCYPDVQTVICGLQLHRRLGRHKHHACKAISVMTCCENLTMSLKHCNTCNSRRIQEV